MGTFTKKLVSEHKELGIKEVCRHIEKANYLPIAKVDFRNNKKIWTWNENDYLIYFDKQITYYGNENKRLKMK